MLAPGSPLLWWSGFPIAFVLTCVIELPGYLAAFAALGWVGRRRSPSGPEVSLTIGRALALALGVNLVTHPILWAVGLALTEPMMVVPAELGVVVVEGALVFAAVVRIRGQDSRVNRLGWSMLTALGVNALSLLIGLIVLPRLIPA